MIINNYYTLFAFAVVPKGFEKASRRPLRTFNATLHILTVTRTIYSIKLLVSEFLQDDIIIVHWNFLSIIKNFRAIGIR